VTILLRQQAQCPVWVNRVILTVRRSLPVHPRRQTSPKSAGTSRSANSDIAGYIIRSPRRWGEQWQREVDAEGLRGFQIANERS
jgi:hypothetical protein